MWKMLSKKVSVESLLSAFPCKHVKITIIILNVNLTSWGQAISKQSIFREGLCHESRRLKIGSFLCFGLQ